MNDGQVMDAANSLLELTFGEIAEIVQDKARLDWLQKEGVAIWTGHYTRWEKFSGSGDDIRATIDQAMNNERTDNGS